MKEIILIFRKPFPGQVSLEFIFYNISDYLKKIKVPISNFELRYYSKGFFNRFLNVLELSSFKNKIIHITGDVHYTLLGAIFSKRVLTIHDFNFMLNKTILSRKIYWIFWIYLPVRLADKVTVISENTRKELLNYISINENKLVVIGDFIDGIYKPRCKIHKNHMPRILQIGTTFNKNLIRLTEALKNIHCLLVIIGKLSKELTDHLEDIGINYENKYNLSIDKLYEEFCNADLLCYVSTSEGFGMPILEAQATGIPVITSNCSSMPEVAGNAALLVDPYDVNAIRAGIINVLNDDFLRNQLITDGFENIKRFSKESVANQYLDLYKKL